MNIIPKLLVLAIIALIVLAFAIPSLINLFYSIVLVVVFILLLLSVEGEEE